MTKQRPHKKLEEIVLGVDVHSCDPVDSYGNPIDPVESWICSVGHFLSSTHDAKVILSGDSHEISQKLKAAYDMKTISEDTARRISVKHSRYRFTMQGDIIDHDGNLIHSKSKSGLRKNMIQTSFGALVSEHKQHNLDVVVSGAHTGSMVTAAVGICKKLPFYYGMPPLTVELPTRKGYPVLLLDIGATVESTKKHMQYFGLTGVSYAQTIMERRRPKVGLLSGSSDPRLCTDVIRQADELFHEMFDVRDDVEYLGLVEQGSSLGLMSGNIDVVVTDGFTGNIMLKTIEEYFNCVKGKLKEIKDKPHKIVKNILTIRKLINCHADGVIISSSGSGTDHHGLIVPSMDGSVSLLTEVSGKCKTTPDDLLLYATHGLAYAQEHMVDKSSPLSYLKGLLSADRDIDSRCGEHAYGRVGPAKKKRPTLGLISNGSEEGKGTMLIQQTHQRYRALFEDFYVGPIEPKGEYGLFSGRADVMVTDDLRGKIIRDTLKDCSALFCHLIRRAAQGAWYHPSSSYRKLKSIVDPSNYNGTPFVNLDYIDKRDGLKEDIPARIFKVHGSSGTEEKAKALKKVYSSIQAGKIREYTAVLKKNCEMYR